MVAARENGYSVKEQRQVVVTAMARYRSAMNEFVAMPILEVWYAYMNLETLFAQFEMEMSQEGRQAGQGGHGQGPDS